MSLSLAGIGHQDLVAALLEQPANPGRVGSGLDGYAQEAARRRSVALKASGVVRSLPSSITSPLVRVDEAQIGVLVAEVQSGCHLWLFAATIHRWADPPSWA